MMKKLVGRKEEVNLLVKLHQEDKAAFVAIYGRRRVGKTFLVKQVFNNSFTFYLTGIANVGTKRQLSSFHGMLQRSFSTMEEIPPATNWFEAFNQLIKGIESKKEEKKVIFLDELPWLDTAKSDFLPALEYFWNSWASAQNDVLLIVCGSAASWMINNLINHRGGLHNRVTHRMLLEPFTLGECENYFKAQGASFGQYQIIQLYMVMGGIPFYLEQVDKGLTAAQNIDKMCFSKNGLLRTEFTNLYASLFKNANRHLEIIEALSKKAKGMSRLEIINNTSFTNGGGLSRILAELEKSGFIRQFKSFGNKVRDSRFQLSDFYSLFYIRFIKDFDISDKNSWLNRIDDPKVRAWSGYAFEQVCLSHLSQIKEALGIRAIQSYSSAWQGADDSGHAQIDLVIDRRDHALNLCEIKFSINPFAIDKSYGENLRKKISIFKAATNTKKSIFLTFITTFGLVQNEHSGSLVQQSLTMDMLFD